MTDETQDEANARTGHDQPCYYCGKPTDSLAGNPGLWPLPFAHRDEPGVVKWHHTHCVTARLVENVERDAHGRTELDDWRQAAEVEAKARRDFQNEVGRLRVALRVLLWWIEYRGMTDDVTSTHEEAPK